MNKLYLILFLALTPSVSAADYTPKDFPRIADAIYKAEGGVHASKPYGILSVKVKSKSDARRVCLNTIKSNYKKWEIAGRKGDFISFMGNSYCPKIADPRGHSVWAKNVNYFLNKNKEKAPKKSKKITGPLLIIR